MQYMKSDDCPLETASTRCDDHMCPPHQWSCGDGQCIPDRFGFHKSKHNPKCVNQRDFYFTCEVNIDRKEWTRPDGRCFSGGIKNTDPIEIESIEDECDYLFRCMLSAGQHVDCLCITSLACRGRFQKFCPLSLVPYPRQPLFTPYMVFLYEPQSVTLTKLPSKISINGTIKCQNSFLQVSETIPYYSNITVRHLMNDLCSSNVSNQFSRCHNEKESTDVC